MILVIGLLVILYARYYLSEKDPMTDLGFDEFWDGVDL